MPTSSSTRALAEADPLGRPPFGESKRSRLRVLRPEHLGSVHADAVLDAASGEPTRVATATRTLEARLLAGDQAEVQIAATLLGHIGDPVDRAKLNRLAGRIEKARWERRGGSAAPSAPVAKPVTTTSEGGQPKQQTADARTATPVARGYPDVEIVTCGGEAARPINSAPVRDPPGTVGADFYGKEEL